MLLLMLFIDQVNKAVKLDYKNKAIFFDRDGVLNYLIKRNGGMFSPRSFADFKLYEDVLPAINSLKSKSFLTIIVSNQPDISRLKMKKEELKKIDKFLYDKLKIDDIFYSFESEYVKGGSKKPSPKMIYEAQKKWKINLNHSFMVGDSIADLECAKNADVKFILMNRNNTNIENKITISNLNDLFKIIF